jgi:hypothetical protein
MGLKHQPRIVTDSLLCYIDAANPRSYIGSGITANGLIGGIGGTLINGVGFTSANKGCFVFDGTNDHIVSYVDLRRDFSLSCWVYQYNINYAYFGLGDPATNAALHIYNTSNGYIRFGMYYNDVDTSGETFSINTWYNYVFTYSHSSPYTKKIYRNGQQLNAPNISGPAQFAGIGTFRIGALWSVYPSSHYANGLMSQILVYGKVLSQQEILQNYNATKGRFGL